jgi:magnesium transporter
MTPKGPRSPALAEDYATASVPKAEPEDKAGEVQRAMLGRRYELATHVVVLSGQALVGIVAVEVLLGAPDDARLGELATVSAPTVSSGATAEHAASRMAERQMAALAVVDEADRFIGLISPQRMLGVLLEEHEEDLARIGGYRAGSRRARRAAEESVSQRLRHRLPWLLVGLLGAMASALLIGSFEEELDKKVLLAFFVPAVVYMADAVGTQTEAILIRGLSVGVTIREVLGRELITGALMGAVVGAAFVPFVLVGWGDEKVAIAVALALFASCAIATAVAMVLPWTFQRLGVDPAFGSGPLATVVQDLLSIAVYLGIAIPLAG